MLWCWTSSAFYGARSLIAELCSAPPRSTTPDRRISRFIVCFLLLCLRAGRSPRPRLQKAGLEMAVVGRVCSRSSSSSLAAGESCWPPCHGEGRAPLLHRGGSGHVHRQVHCRGCPSVQKAWRFQSWKVASLPECIQAQRRAELRGAVLGPTASPGELCAELRWCTHSLVRHEQHQEGARNWRDVERGGSPSLLCLVDHLLQIPYGCCSQRGQQLSQRLQGRAPWLPPPLPWILSAGSTNWLRALPSKQEPGRQATVVVSSLRICQICERKKMNGHKQQRKNMAVLSSKAPGVRG